MREALRIVVVAPDLALEDPQDEHAVTQAARSRALRIGFGASGRQGQHGTRSHADCSAYKFASKSWFCVWVKKRSGAH